MIRLLTKDDQTTTLQFLYEEQSYNIFPIGDIEHFGFDQDFQQVYGEFDSNNNLIAVFLRYRENAIYYAKEDRFNTAFLGLFEKHDIQYLSGKTALMDLIQPHIPNFDHKKMYFCHAKELRTKPSTTVEIKRIYTKDELAKLYDLLATIPEFHISKKARDLFVEQQYESLKMGLKFYIEEDGKMVATVATTAETSVNAMVVAVATHKDYRKKGYASELMIHLMDYYIHEKQKELCLFYNNPEAGKIYLRLGFEYIGTWDMYERRNAS